VIPERLTEYVQTRWKVPFNDLLHVRDKLSRMVKKIFPNLSREMFGRVKADSGTKLR